MMSRWSKNVLRFWFSSRKDLMSLIASMIFLKSSLKIFLEKSSVKRFLLKLSLILLMVSLLQFSMLNLYVLSFSWRFFLFGAHFGFWMKMFEFVFEFLLLMDFFFSMDLFGFFLRIVEFEFSLFSMLSMFFSVLMIVLLLLRLTITSSLLS